MTGLAPSFSDHENHSQAHKKSDVDTSPIALHHTLGYGPNQAAPGNHNHLPAGVIQAWLFGDIPEGWFELNGQAIDRRRYHRLFDLWGTTFGNGDGSTTFNLPDARDRFLQGAGNGGDPGDNDGVGFASRAALLDLVHAHAYFDGHNHTYNGVGLSADTAGNHDHGGNTGQVGQAPVDRSQGATNTAGAAHTHPISNGGSHFHNVIGSSTTGNTGGFQVTNNSTDSNLPYLIVTWIVNAV